MNILIYALYLALFIGLAAFSLLFRKVVSRQARTVQIDPHTILVTSYFLYAGSLPFSRLIMGSIGQEFDETLMRMHLFGFLGFALASIISVPFVRRYEIPREGALNHVLHSRYSQTSLRTGLYIGLLGILAARYFWLLFEALGFNLANIFQPYGFEALEGGAQTNLADVFVYFGLYTSLVFGVVWDRRVRPLPSILRVTVYALICMLVVFWLLRGSRNMVALLVLPMVAGVFYKRQIRVGMAVVVCVAVVVGFYTLAGVRSVGLTNVSQSDVINVITGIDPLYGELGTSYSVLDRALGIGTDSDLLLGESYTVHPVVNLVPRSWWPSRPDNLAVRFSKRYFNTDQLTEGLGFSPVLEAYLNFGQLGIIGVFAVIFLTLVILEERHPVGNICYILLIAFALPNIINWNRIDMSTAFKMYSGYIMMSFLIPKILLRDNRPFRQ